RVLIPRVAGGTVSVGEAQLEPSERPASLYRFDQLPVDVADRVGRPAFFEVGVLPVNVERGDRTGLVGDDRHPHDDLGDTGRYHHVGDTQPAPLVGCERNLVGAVPFDQLVVPVPNHQAVPARHGGHHRNARLVDHPRLDEQGNLGAAELGGGVDL